MTTHDTKDTSLLDRLPIPRRLWMPAVIAIGLVGGSLVGMLLPRDWVIAPAVADPSIAKMKKADGGQKEYYA